MHGPTNARSNSAVKRAVIRAIGKMLLPDGAEKALYEMNNEAGAIKKTTCAASVGDETYPLLWKNVITMFAVATKTIAAREINLSGFLSGIRWSPRV